MNNIETSQYRPTSNRIPEHQTPPNIDLGSADLPTLEKTLGQSLKELPYSTLQNLLPDGSDNEEVAALLRSKREAYLLDHPEEEQSKGASEGVITFDGSFIPMKEWRELDSDVRHELLIERVV